MFSFLNMTDDATSFQVALPNPLGLTGRFAKITASGRKDFIADFADCLKLFGVGEEQRPGMLEAVEGFSSLIAHGGTATPGTWQERRDRAPSARTYFYRQQPPIVNDRGVPRRGGQEPGHVRSSL